MKQTWKSWMLSSNNCEQRCSFKTMSLTLITRIWTRKTSHLKVNSLPQKQPLQWKKTLRINWHWHPNTSSRSTGLKMISTKSSRMLLSTSCVLKKSSIRPKLRLLNYLSSLKKQKLMATKLLKKSNCSKPTSSTSNHVLLFTSQSRVTPSTRRSPSTSTTTLTDRSSRLCSCESRRVFTSLAPNASPLKLTKTRSTFESAAVSSPSTNSSTSTHLPSWRRLSARTRWRDSQRK